MKKSLSWVILPRKADLTGSVSVVKMKDVADTPTGNVVQALQGRVAGMNITTDGTPGGLSTEHQSEVHPLSVEMPTVRSM